MRLIDADALRKRVLRARWGGWIRGDVVEQVIDSEPTIDPVVRCKDCEYWYPEEDDEYGHCRKHDLWASGSWYCADGERRRE